MSDILDMPWLPRSEANWSTRLKSLDLNDVSSAAMELVTLSKPFLSEPQLAKLASAKAHLSAGSRTLTSVRLHLLGDLTMEHLVAPLEGTGVRWGLDVQASVSGFGQTRQEIFSDTTPFWDDAVNVFVIFLSPLDFIVNTGTLPNNPNNGEHFYNSTIAFFEQSILRIRDKAPNAEIVLTTLSRPASRFLGSLEHVISDSAALAIDRINVYIRNSDYKYIDLDHLACRVGLDRWYSNKYLDIAKYPFSPNIVPLFCDYVARFVAGLYGKRKKCLVVDLDNTLWGGVVGDDGVENIEIGYATASGQAFLRLQSTIKNLAQLGIMLAVCSKNDEEIARQAFQARAEMILTESDFLVFKANWSDKASNIQDIADTLNIGTDAIVFLDDNPVERELVQKLLPEVSVIELPEERSNYANLLLDSGLFDTHSLTNEDRQKTELYKQNSKREAFGASVPSLDDFLRGLEMQMIVEEMTDNSKLRMLQLVNKTNQFNMTGRRLTASDLEAYASSERKALSVRLQDKFGDNGIVSVVLLRLGADRLHIENWVMSCRVLKRGVEDALFGSLVDYAAANGSQHISADLCITAKNAMVQDLYARYGLTDKTLADGTTKQFSQQLDQVVRFDHFIHITRL